MSFSKDLLALIHYYLMVFIVGFILFCSAFLGFLVYHWFPLFVTLGTRTNVVSTLVANPFLIFPLFSPFEVPPPPKKKSLVDLPLLRCSKGWLSILLFPKLLDATFQTHHFGCSTFCHFLYMGRFLSGWKILSHLPSWSTFLHSLRYQTSFFEVLIPKPSAFFWTMGS